MQSGVRPRGCLPWARAAWDTPDPVTRGPPGPRTPTGRAERGAHAFARPVCHRQVARASPRGSRSDPWDVTWRHARARRRREVVPGRHTRTYHGHRAGGGCRASRAYAGTDTRPSLPPAFLSGLVFQVGPPRAAGMPSAREHPPPSAKPAGSCSLNA